MLHLVTLDPGAVHCPNFAGEIPLHLALTPTPRSTAAKDKEGTTTAAPNSSSSSGPAAAAAAAVAAADSALALLLLEAADAALPTIVEPYTAPTAVRAASPAPATLLPVDDGITDTVELATAADVVAEDARQQRQQELDSRLKVEAEKEVEEEEGHTVRTVPLAGGG